MCLKASEIKNNSLLVVESSNGVSSIFFVHEVNPSSVDNEVFELKGNYLSDIFRYPGAYYPFSKKSLTILRISEFGSKKIQAKVKNYRLPNRDELKGVFATVEKTKVKTSESFQDLLDIILSGCNLVGTA